MFTYGQIFDDKQNILFVGAHPDDVIVFFGALIHKLVQDHKNVYVVSVTDGCRGSREHSISEKELGEIRIQEDVAALAYLGVPRDHYTCLKYKDGEVESNLQLIGKIAKYIRKYKADIVATHEPTKIYHASSKKDGFFVQHRDHRKVGEAVIDAVYPFARDRSFFTEHAEEQIEPHSVYELLLTSEVSCNCELDYTKDVNKKTEALTRYKSQFDQDSVKNVVELFSQGGTYREKYQYLKLLW